MARKNIKKKLKPDGTVVHDMGLDGNWNAAVTIRNQSRPVGEADSRKLWTALPTVHT